MQNKELICIWHSTFHGNIFNDPNYNITYGFLKQYFNRDETYIIRHSLFTGGESGFYSGDTKLYNIPYIGKFPGPIRYIFELFSNIGLLLWYRPNLVLAIDPLSAFIPVLFKKIGIIQKVFFLTPDFSKKRFNNSILNYIYFWLDEFCTRNSTINICSSLEVIKYKKSLYGLDENTFFHLPNIPNLELLNDFKGIEKIKNRIIYVGEISDHIDFKFIIQTVFNLKKDFPDISFAIVGSGGYVDELKDFINKFGIDNVQLLGQLSFTLTLNEIAKSEIGIATYRGNLEYDGFRDSCKIREYQALGCIPITTDIVISNSQEIKKYKSGIIVSSDLNDLSDSLIKAIINRQDYIKGMEENNGLYINYFNKLYTCFLS